MDIVDPDLEQYAALQTREVEKVFMDLKQMTYEHCDNPDMQVGKVEGTFLRILARLIGARRVLEIGTFTGYSALMMASVLPAEGELVTLERDETHARAAQRYFDEVPYGRRIKIVRGDARKTIMDVRGPFDLVFIDADKSSYDLYYERALSELRPGGLIVLDNMLWKGEVLSPQGKDAKAIDALNRKLVVDERVDNVLLTLRDGVMLAVKR
jgi:caffeoyl-CoA O-methyltransferase